MIQLLKGDCLTLQKEIDALSCDLILTDLPYGNMYGINDSFEWDIVVETLDVMNIFNRILRKNGKIVLFAQQPFTTKLINNALPNLKHCYNMIWEKDNFANPLFAKKAPVNYYEDILVFTKSYDLKYVTPDNEAFLYFQQCKAKSGITTKEFNNMYCEYVGKTTNINRGMVARCWETSQFWFPNQDIYENVLQPTGFFKEEWKILNKINDDFKHKFESVFNLWEEKKYKSNILKYKKDYSGYHPTQKPVLLLEDLIRTFSNENDLVVDLTMGSGSTGVACKNLNRNFIGIEQDDNYFNVAKKRINEI